MRVYAVARPLLPVYNRASPNSLQRMAAPTQDKEILGKVAGMQVIRKAPIDKVSRDNRRRPVDLMTNRVVQTREVMPTRVVDRRMVVVLNNRHDLVVVFLVGVWVGVPVQKVLRVLSQLPARVHHLPRRLHRFGSSRPACKTAWGTMATLRPKKRG